MNARGWFRAAGRRRAGVLVLLALAAACDRGRGEAPKRTEGGGDQPRRGGTAVVAEIADVQAPFPLFFVGGLDSDMMDMMYMGLTRGAWRDGRLVALLSDRSPMAMAWHWEYVGPDSTRIRYRMRSALRWSDGTPITAHDVVFTYGLYSDSALASPRLSNMEQIDSVAAENDSTVVFHFKRRYAEMIFDSGLAIIPRHVYRDVPPARMSTHPSISRPQTLVVSGAFMIGDHRPGEQITMVPNPHFPVRPLLDRVVIRVIPEPTTRLVELRNGTVDFARGVTFDQIAALRQQAPGVRFDVETGRFWEYLGYNMRRPMFADVNVRRALGLAIDVPGIIRQLRMEEWVTQAAGPYGPTQRDFFDPQRMRPLPFDTLEARRLLEAAGWRDTDGDGIREKDGRPFRFTLLTNTANQRRTDVSQILQRMWRAVGVDARLQAQEFGTVQERQFGPGHDFDVVLGSWGVELSGVLSPLFSPDAHLNFVGFDDAEAVRLMRQAEAQPTLATAAPLWRGAAERIVQTHPYTWLYWYGPVTARSARLRGVRVDTYGAYQNLWEWWVADGAGGRAAGDTAGGDTAQRDTGR